MLCMSSKIKPQCRKYDNIGTSIVSETSLLEVVHQNTCSL